MGYRICPYCGAALDAAEKCDCRDETALAGNAAPQEKEYAGAGQGREHNGSKRG